MKKPAPTAAEVRHELARVCPAFRRTRRPRQSPVLTGLQADAPTERIALERMIARESKRQRIQAVLDRQWLRDRNAAAADLKRRVAG